eukprot:gene9655-1859_t
MKFLTDDISVDSFTKEQEELFETYRFDKDQKRIFHIMKTLKNKPTWWKEMDEEHICWVIGVKKFDARGDMKFYKERVEAMLNSYMEAEKQYKWISGKWTKELLKILINDWSCGLIVSHPNFKTKEGSPIQFVYEYYGENYPEKKDQTDEWKQLYLQKYVYMVRSLNKCYPEATIHGLVSISDMHEFSHEKYDFGMKMDHSNIQSLIPNKLIKMLQVNADPKMKQMYKDYGTKVLERYGFVLYEDFDECYEKEKEFLPDRKLMPKFVGGEGKLDILECLKLLFRREKETLELLIKTYEEMEKNGEIIKPKHMQ